MLRNIAATAGAYLLLIAVHVAVAHAEGTRAGQPVSTFTNPLQGQAYNQLTGTISDGPYFHGDVRVVRDGARYVGSGSGCQVLVSDDMLRWRYAATQPGSSGTPVPVEVCGPETGMHPPAMVMDPVVGQDVTFWGTEVLRVGSRWVLVTSGARRWPERGADYTRGAIWVGVASQPQGPYSWAADATVMTPDATLIDPTIFTDPTTGAHWLLWAARPDHPTRSVHKLIVAQQLDPADPRRVAAGSSPVTILGTDVNPQPRELVNSAGSRSVEGPGLVHVDGSYLLYYAAGDCEYDHATDGGAAYTLNVARADRFPVPHAEPGAFAKPAAPLISGGNGWRLPGHGALYQDGSGDWWAATSPLQDGEPLCQPMSTWCMTRRTVVAQRLTYRPELSTFVADNPLVDPGPIVPPA